MSSNKMSDDMASAGDVAVLFSQEEIHRLYRNVLRARIDPDRLLDELDAQLRATLAADASTEADSLLLTFSELNRIRMADGTIPFRVVLRTARLLSAGKAEQRVFQRALESLDARFPEPTVDTPAPVSIPGAPPTRSFGRSHFARWMLSFAVGFICCAAIAFTLFLTRPKRQIAAHSSPIANVVDVDRLPEATECAKDGICITRDIIMWDLREVLPVADSQRKAGKISPVRFFNYLHLVRQRPEETIYRRHYSTSGYGIDFNAATHNIVDGSVKRTSSVIGHHDNHLDEKYALELDVSHEAVGREFLLIIEGTFWNGFRFAQEWAEIYSEVDQSPSTELAMLLLFPPEYRPRNVSRFDVPDDDAGGVGSPFNGLEVFLDGQGRYLYWSIRSHSAGRHYRLRWDWDLPVPSNAP